MKGLAHRTQSNKYINMYTMTEEFVIFCLYIRCGAVARVRDDLVHRIHCVKNLLLNYSQLAATTYLIYAHCASFYLLYSAVLSVSTQF